MKTIEKIDISGEINVNQLLSRLLNLQRDYQRNFTFDLETPSNTAADELKRYCENICKENFLIENENKLKIYSTHLALFFLGNEKSAFCKI